MNRSKLAAMIAGAVLLVATVLVPATAFAAGSGTLTVDPTPVTTSNGSTFTVDVYATPDGGVFPSGASAKVVFDKTRLQIVSIAKGADWNAAGADWAGYPTPANMASFIATANGTGTLATIAAYFSDGTSAMSDDPNRLLSVTFQAIACGDSEILLPIGPAAGGMLEGTPGQPYGDPLTVTSTAGTVVNSCATPTPTPTPTPSAQPPAQPADATANVTGTVDAGFLGLTCPAAITIPLIRNATNVKDFSCTVYSNIIWVLNVSDPKVTNTGFMTDGSKVLANPMHVLNDGIFDRNLQTGGSVATGANSTSVLLTLSQFGAPQDLPGNYGIQVIFSAVSGF